MAAKPDNEDRSICHPSAAKIFQLLAFEVMPACRQRSLCMTINENDEYDRLFHESHPAAFARLAASKARSSVLLSPTTREQVDSTKWDRAAQAQQQGIVLKNPNELNQFGRSAGERRSERDHWNFSFFEQSHLGFLRKDARPDKDPDTFFEKRCRHLAPLGHSFVSTGKNVGLEKLNCRPL